MKLQDKVVVVTGAGNGIGRQLTLGLLARGAKVAAVDVNERTLAETAALAGNRAANLSVHGLDITNRAAVEALPGAVAARFGAVDGLINCAGIIQPFLPVRELDRAIIDRVFAINWGGTLSMTLAFLPVLLERPEAHLVNVSSMGGFFPFPGQTLYGASKAAVKLLTEGLQAELSGTPVRVTVVVPGGVDTNITSNSGVELSVANASARKLILTAEKAARIILDGVEKNRPRVLVGTDAKVLDLVYRLSPRWATGFISKQLKRLLLPGVST